MSASQAVSLTCSVAPGRRRVRGWGRRGAARARATCVRATCAGCGAACGPRYDMRFGFSSAHARTARVPYMLFNPRANPVTASYGNGPRRDHAANVRPEAHALPTSRASPSGSGPATLYIEYTSPRIPPRRLLSKRARLTSHKRALGHTHAVRHHWQSGPRERSRGEAASHPS